MDIFRAFKKQAAPVHQLALRIEKLSELFNSMDPTPFHHCNLDKDAEAYIESWAMGFAHGSHFRIHVHIAQMPADDPESTVTQAIHHYFEYKTVLTKQHLRLLLAEGRTSLGIGLVFLALCLLGADLLSAYTGSPLLRVFRESLIIGGWVAMWRPMQIFLYEWWPAVRRGKIYRNLSKASVQVVQDRRVAAATA